MKPRGRPRLSSEDYENVEPPPLPPPLPPPHLHLKACQHHGGGAAVPPPGAPPISAPPPPAVSPGGSWGRLLLGLALALGVLAAVGTAAIGVQTQPLFQALAELRAQQQQLQQEVTALRGSAVGPCPRCPPGWVGFGASCYHFSAAGRRWREAEGSCAAQGGLLLVLETAAEQDFVLRTAPQPRGYWLGLSDRDNEGGWRWLDGAPLGFSSWGRGEPNGGRSQNCAALLPDGRWDDLGCERALHWVCERPPTC